MGIIELILIGIGLSMDAFAVSLCKGLAMIKFNYKKCIIISSFFGFAQAIMVLLGYLLAAQFEVYVRDFAHWITFILLTCIGAKMAYEAFSDSHKQKVKQSDSESYGQADTSSTQAEAMGSFSIKELFFLAIATSIDAFAVGIAFALVPSINVTFSAILIGIITFSLSFLGVIIGTIFGNKYENSAKFLGGVILIAIGVLALFS